MSGAQGRPRKAHHTQNRSGMPAAVATDAPPLVAAPWVPWMPVRADDGAPAPLVSAARTAERRSHQVVLGRGGRAPPVAGRLVSRKACGGPSHAPSRCPTPAALRAGHVSAVGVRLLGLVLAAGLRLRVAARRAARLRVRVRHAAVVVAPRQLRSGLRAVSDHLQHEPVSLVQGRLVLPAVPARGRRIPREGVRQVAA